MNRSAGKRHQLFVLAIVAFTFVLQAVPASDASGPVGKLESVRRKTRAELLDYQFTNELGQAVSLRDFHGQALAITFFFSRCPIPQYCPRLARNFQEASRKLSATSNAPTNWHFLSFSFDPDFDSPPVLKAYGERYQYEPRHWSFLTGGKDKVAVLASESNVTFEPDNGFYNHNFRTLIIDPPGICRWCFRREAIFLTLSCRKCLKPWQ